MLEALRFGHEANPEARSTRRRSWARSAGKTKRAVLRPQATRSSCAASRHGRRAHPRGQAARARRRRATRRSTRSKRRAEAIVEPFRASRASFGTLAEVEAALGRPQADRDLQGILHDMRGKAMRDASSTASRASTAARPPTSARSRARCGELPRIHGSALFTRGETQAIVTVDAGRHARRADDRGPARTRATGRLHAALQLPAVLASARPSRCAAPAGARGPRRARRARGRSGAAGQDELPVHDPRRVARSSSRTARSSMATVCGGALALMDAGVADQGAGGGHRHGPDRGGHAPRGALATSSATRTTWATWTSRSRGTAQGITAIQMDIKIDGLDWAVMEQALEQARQGRLHILQRMADETAADAARLPAARRALARTRRASA